MNEGRKFYWLKLRRDFFKRHDVRILEASEGGRDALLVLLKLMAESVDHEGRLRYSERQPYTPQMLAVLIGETPEAIGQSLELLERLEFIATEPDGTMTVTQVPGMVGSAADNDNANRQRRFREKQGAEALRKVTDSVTKNNERQRQDTESDTETERERQTETDKTGGRRLACPPSVTEVARYCDENGLSVDAEEFCNYFDGEDWIINGERIRNWRAVIRSWERHRMTS